MCLFTWRSVVGSVVFFFFKQKTAYEMRISDWSSDVCSSDLPLKLARGIGFVAGTLVHEVASRREGFRVTLTRIAGSGAFRAGCLSLFFRLPGSLRDSLFGRVLRDPIAPLRTRDFARYFAPEEARRLGLVTNTETDFRRTIVWFGHHGSGHGRYGMSRVADPVPLLEKVDRKSVVSGTRVSVRVDLGGRSILKKKKKNNNTQIK